MRLCFQREDEKVREKESERLIHEDMTAIRDKEMMKRKLITEARKNLLQDVLKERGDQLQNKREYCNMRSLSFQVT